MPLMLGSLLDRRPVGEGLRGYVSCLAEHGVSATLHVAGYGSPRQSNTSSLGDGTHVGVVPSEQFTSLNSRLGPVLKGCFRRYANMAPMKFSWGIMNVGELLAAWCHELTVHLWDNVLGSFVECSGWRSMMTSCHM